VQAFAAKVKQNKEKIDNGISHLTVFLSESDNLCILSNNKNFEVACNRNRDRCNKVKPKGGANLMTRSVSWSVKYFRFLNLFVNVVNDIHKQLV